MNTAGKKRFALASITALSGCVAIVACGGSSATIDVLEAFDGSLANPVPTQTATSTATGTTSGSPPPAPVDSGARDAAVDSSTGDDDDDDSTVVDSGTDSSVPDAGVDSGVDAGDSGTGSCLDPTPIDQTRFRYVKAATPAKGTCSAKEQSDFVAYFRANQNDLDIDGWAATVDRACAACIFTNETTVNATSWDPIITANGDISKVNRGGCIEIVSGSFQCGRAYQQFQDCTVAACTKNCATTADFGRCRQDPEVLTTACKNAFQAVQTQCGDKIGQWETSCRGTTYTFEGPIRVSCGGPVDAGVQDSGPRDSSADSGDAAKLP